MIYGCDVAGFKKILKDKKMSQIRLSGLLGLSIGQTHDRVNAVTAWSGSQALRVCIVLGITKDEFKSCYPYIWPLIPRVVKKKGR